MRLKVNEWVIESRLHIWSTCFKELFFFWGWWSILFYLDPDSTFSFEISYRPDPASNGLLISSPALRNSRWECHRGVLLRSGNDSMDFTVLENDTAESDSLVSYTHQGVDKTKWPHDVFPVSFCGVNDTAESKWTPRSPNWTRCRSLVVCSHDTVPLSLHPTFASDPDITQISVIFYHADSRSTSSLDFVLFCWTCFHRPPLSLNILYFFGFENTLRNIQCKHALLSSVQKGTWCSVISPLRISKKRW